MATLRKRIRAAWATLRGSEPRATAFSGGASSRLTNDWIFAATRSPDQEIRGDIRVLKNRARDLSRNNPHARRFRRLLSHNVVGPHGVRLQAKVKDARGESDRETNRKIEAAFKEWSRKGICTADGRLSFAQVQRLYVETMAVDGEALIRLLPGFRNDFGFAVQVLDTDQLDAEFNRAAGSGKNEIRMGVEIDGWGRPVAYHLWDGHPTETGRREGARRRIPAEQIIHDFIGDRPGQTRGVTSYAPILFRAKMLDGYEEAAVVGARAGATNMGFFVPNAQDPPQIDPNDPGEIPFEAEPGAFKKLPLGYSFEEYNPNQPTASFSEFDKAMLRSLAAGLDVGYCSLTGDLSDVNYSSIRQGKIDERDVFRVLQTGIIESLMERVYAEWLKWAITMGALVLPSRNAARYSAHSWQARGWDWVDPLKDIMAADASVALGVNSRTRICAERGLDFEDVLIELADEQRLAESHGVTLGTVKQVHAAALIGASKDDGDGDNEAGAHWLNRIDAQLNGNGNGNGRHALNGKG